MNRSHVLLVVLAFIAFVAIGMPDGLLGVAWPSIRRSFSLPLDAAGLLISAVVIGGLISSVSSGPLVARFGVGNILAWSCGLTGAGLIGYTLIPFWWMMVLLGVVAGLGAGAIDSGLNTYAAAHFSEGRMQWLHACYGLGITLGPIIMTGALTLTDSWRVGYRIVGGIQIALAIWFSVMRQEWNRGGEYDTGRRFSTDVKTPLRETLLQPRVWLSIMLFVVYTGAEVAFGTWAYVFLTDSRGMNPDLAGLLVAGYWGSFTIGRISAGMVARWIGMHHLLKYGLVAAVVSALVLWWNPFPIVNLVAVPLIGFAIAPIFPGLVSGTRERVGARFSANTIGLQMAAAGVGVATIPGAVGTLSRHTSLESVPPCMVILYVVLLALLSAASSPKEQVRSVPATDEAIGF